MAAESSSASTAPPGRYHSTSELTMPNSSRLIRSGAMSARSEPSADGGRDEGGQPVVDLAAALQRGQLDLAVAAHPQQQRDGGQVGDEHLDRLRARPAAAARRR